MRRLLSRLVREETGGELIDYVLVVGLIVVVSITAVHYTGMNLATKWRMIVDAL